MHSAGSLYHKVSFLGEKLTERERDSVREEWAERKEGEMRHPTLLMNILFLLRSQISMITFLLEAVYVYFFIFLLRPLSLNS